MRHPDIDPDAVYDDVAQEENLVDAGRDPAEVWEELSRLPLVSPETHRFVEASRRRAG